MLNFEQSHLDELQEIIRYDNAVLFLGQDYQLSLGGENYFVNEIIKRVCRQKVSSPSYSDLWSKMSEDSTSIKKVGGHAVLDDVQKNRLLEIGGEIPQNKKLSELLNCGWASVITSSIDPGIVQSEGVSCTPIYTISNRPAGIANKKKLHITYMFGCIKEDNSYPVTYRIRNDVKTNAEDMYTRVLKEAIQYSGALLIDGWNPSTDWASLATILGNGIIDADMPFPKIYIFSCSQEIRGMIYESEYTEELAESDKVIVSESSLYECLHDFIIEIAKERQEELEALESSETISFQRGKRTITINIPRSQLRELDPERIHILTPRDRIQVAFDQEGLRNLTIKFLSNSSGSFPYWQGYLHGCCFDRDIYENSQKTGLYDRALAILQASNLHKSNSTIIIHGPSNSGKTILLGKLAMDLSRNYPVLYINGELEADDPEVTRRRYQNIVTFINTYITRNTQTGGKIRAVVIWDNDAFIDKLQNYHELARELAESNTILVGSAYEIRDTEELIKRPKKGVEYISISSILNLGTEFSNMENMLSRNLGEEIAEVFSRVRKTYVNKTNQPDLIHDDNRILSLLQRTFRIAGEDAGQIIDEAVNRANIEAAGAEEIMRNRIEEAIHKASKHYNIDLTGLAEILAQCTDEEEKNEEWYHQLKICAPTLNDILAIAGQFGIRLPLKLVQDVICDADICPDIKFYMDAVEDILSFDTMLEYPFPVDEVGHVMVGYRSPEEAEIYLLSHYKRREKNYKDEFDSEGNYFLEDREIYILEKLIEHSDLEDYSSFNWHKVTTVRELLDQFGSNSRKGEQYASQYTYKYDELATFILQHGGSENPEMALSAAFLKREQLTKSMVNSVSYNYNIKQEEKRILDDAADGLEHAIEIEERDNPDDTPRKMRIYVEWCTNRNYTLDRETPGPNDIELFHQIHTRFAKALSIYLRQTIHRMKPLNMMDVYLNGFSYYSMAMEKLYHVISNPANADPIKMSEYIDEVSFAMNTVLGNLLDFDEITDSNENKNQKILNVYKLAKKSIHSLEAKARAHGSAAYILLNARSMWVRQDDNLNDTDILNVKDADLYLISDFAEGVGNTPPEMVACAKNVYTYLTQPDNLNVLLSRRTRGEKEVAALEMLIRATWIAKTGNVPFTLNQFPKLEKKDWEEIHKYCRVYVNSENERAKYAFAYYLEGIYYWTFTADTWNYVTRTTPSKEQFDFCYRSGIRPHGVYPSDSFIFLCELGTGKPVKFNARINKRSAYRDEADISSAVFPSMIKEMPNVTHRQKIFCAQSLQRQSQRNSIESRVITIRFNLRGALAGPENPEMEGNLYGKE